MKPPNRAVLSTTLAMFVLVLVPAGLAAKGGNGSKTNDSSSNLSLVVVSASALNSTGTVPHWGQDVTFEVSTTATDRPFVTLNCYVNGAWVYSGNAAFFDGYPNHFTLANSWWTSGPGDCTATLYMTSDGAKSTTLATLSFHVYA